MIDAASNPTRVDLRRRGGRSHGGAQSLRVEPRSIRPPAPPSEVRQTPADTSDLVLAAQMEERRRLAGELHDSVGQQMVALSLGVGRLRREAGLPPDARLIIDEMAATLERAHAEIRTFSFLLQSPEGKDVETELRDLATGFARRAGLAAEVRIAPLGGRLCGGRKLTLVRILQEALVNIHRHAHASAVTVDLARKRGSIVLTVRDDGRGLSAPADGGLFREGVGLASMRARLRRFGGDLTVASDSTGVTLVAKMPS